MQCALSYATHTHTRIGNGNDGDMNHVAGISRCTCVRAYTSTTFSITHHSLQRPALGQLLLYSFRERYATLLLQAFVTTQDDAGSGLLLLTREEGERTYSLIFFICCFPIYMIDFALRSSTYRIH